MGKAKSVIIGNQKQFEIPTVDIMDKAGNNIEITKTKIQTKIIKKYLFPAAPMGTAQTTFKLNNKYWTIKIIDKVFTPDEEILQEYDSLNTYLLNNGFVDCSVAVPIGEAKENIKKIKRLYKVGHPDNTPNNKKNGNVSVNIDGEDKVLKCVNGVIATENEKIYNRLIKEGWYEAGIEEMEVK